MVIMTVSFELQVSRVARAHTMFTKLGFECLIPPLGLNSDWQEIILFRSTGLFNGEKVLFRNGLTRKLCIQRAESGSQGLGRETFRGWMQDSEKIELTAPFRFDP